MPSKNKKYKLAVLTLSLLLILETAILASFLLGRKKPPRPPVKIAPAGKIAIVLDDWGYNLHNLALLEAIEYPLTVSVLPNLPYSRRICEALVNDGVEIMLHLPMEPQEKLRLEKNTLLTTMSQETVSNIITQDLSSVVYAKGISNHMGSQATQDRRLMESIFRELKKRRLYFLDSLVSAQSLGSTLAEEINLPFARRDIFLDNQEDAGYIRQQIAKLKARAKAYGQAIGVGHDRKVTLEVLKEIMPQIAKEGYKFVFVSEVVK